MQIPLARAWVEIDLGALLRNAARVAEHAGVRLLPMVKADAYGLGAVRVARALEALDPWGFGVATVEEGAELRRAHVERPIVVFTPVLLEQFDALRHFRLTPALGTRHAIERWSEYGLPWQLAIDTGMNRAGAPWDAIDDLREAVLLHPPEGVFTHFHSAESDAGASAEQVKRFASALDALPARPALVHAENSPALAQRGAPGGGRAARAAHAARPGWSVARPGIFLYGVNLVGETTLTPEPVASLRARVVELRDVAAGETVSYGGSYRAATPRRIATVPVGYADGYRRALGNAAHALVRGRRAPVVGVVTMDMTMLDVTAVECAIGDVVTLLGRDGADVLTVADVAAAGSLSPYELLTGLRGRLPRRYLSERRHPGR